MPSPTAADLYTRLESLGTEQTRKTCRRHGAGENVFGVSFADLYKLQKECVGRGKDRTAAHRLAQQLWTTGNIDAQALAFLIADPEQLTQAEADIWASDLRYYPIADLLAALIAKTAFCEIKMQEWMAASTEMHQRLGYTMLGHLASQNAGLPDAYFAAYIGRLQTHLQQAPNRAKEAMNNCLISIGSRTPALRQRVEQAARLIGPVSIDHGDTKCQTFVIEEYLERVWARKEKRMTR